MDLVEKPDAWILRKSSVKDLGRWTLQRSCATDRVGHIETWILPAKAAEDPRHQLFDRSLDLMCAENRHCFLWRMLVRFGPVAVMASCTSPQTLFGVACRCNFFIWCTDAYICIYMFFFIRCSLIVLQAFRWYSGWRCWIYPWPWILFLAWPGFKIVSSKQMCFQARGLKRRSITKIFSSDFTVWEVPATCFSPCKYNIVSDVRCVFRSCAL